MEFDIVIKRSIIVFRFAAVVLFFYLSFTFFTLALQSYKTKFAPSPFYSSLANERESLQKQADLARQQLDFMVFDKEKNQTKQSLIKLLQAQINLYPFDSALWRELSYWQASLKSSETPSQAHDRQWTFLISKELLQWNKHERPFLLNQCLRFIADSLIDVNKPCKQIFDVELQGQSQASLVKKLKLSPEQWQAVVKYFALVVIDHEG